VPKILSLTVLSVVLVTGTACRKAPAPTEGAATTPPAASAAAAPTPPPGTPPAAPQPEPAPAPPAAPVPAQLPNVLAHVNSEKVTKADFERLLRNIELNNGAPVPAERRNEIYRRVLDELVNYTLLKQEAKARNFTVTDAEVDTQMQSVRESAGGEAAFKKALADRKMTVERLRADARVEMAIAKMMSAQVATATEATDAEARDFYDKNPDRFKRGETVRASHILLRVDPGADEATKKQVQAKIEDILKRAKSGEDFAALAQQHSQDGSAQQGGDLGYFPREKMVPAFSEAAFALKPGEISSVVTTQFGVHVIKLTDRKPAGTVPLEEVSPQVKQFLTEQKKQQQAQAFIAQVKQKAKIEVLI
jgi:peptidyl-prolyl cis-trans isomerase C